MYVMENIRHMFARYTQVKYDRFARWLATPHGQQIYSMFKGFARTYRDAGHRKCGANLIGNRIRWEMSTGSYNGYKIPNDFIPMLARQLAADDPSWADFFVFYGEAAGKAVHTP